MSASHILITGASSGIGRALALAYAAPGVRLVLTGRDRARLDDVAQACAQRGAEAETATVDVRDREGLKQLIEAADKKRPLDLVVANAGITSALSTGLMMEDPDSVRAVIAINQIGVFNTLEPAMPLMCARKSGHLAIVGSMAGLRGLPQCPAYCAAKAAVHGWAESIRGLLGGYGVAVSLIAPGFVETPMLAKAKTWTPGAMSDAQAAEIIKRGLDRRKPLIAFPLYVYYAMRLFSFLPSGLVDAVMRRVRVEAPQTHERETL